MNKRFRDGSKTKCRLCFSLVRTQRSTISSCTTCLASSGVSSLPPPSGRWCSQGCTEESQISDPAKKMLVFYQKFKECGIMFLKNSENTSGAFASWYWAMDKDKDVPTLPILASFWRTFRSACPPFPYSPAFGGHSGLHAHLSQTCQLLEDIQVCMPTLPSSLFSHWSECGQAVFSLFKM